MKSKLTKLSAAAAIVVVAVLMLMSLDRTSPAAYALEQTLQAFHDLHFLHIKDFKEDLKDPKEFWLEFDVTGKIRNIRASMPEWDSPEDGAKEILWNDGKAQVWFKKKNSVLTVSEQRFADILLAMAVTHDPKMVVQYLQEDEKNGRVKIEIQEPKTGTDPILVTATPVTPGARSEYRQVLSVDPATRLVFKIDHYQPAANGEYKLFARTEMLEYNQPIDPQRFQFENLPADVVRIDQTARDLGLAIGAWSKEQVAQEVARQFFQALLDGNYDQAGKLAGGIPGDAIRKMLGTAKVVRIVSAGPAGPHPVPETQGLVVPSTIEIEKDGKRFERQFNRFGVRPVYNQPDRWNVFGGFDERSFDPNVPNDTTPVTAPPNPPAKANPGRELSPVEKAEQPKVKDTAGRLFRACEEGNWDEFTKLFSGFQPDERVKIILKSMKLHTLGEPYKKDNSENWYIPYQFQGEGRERTLRARYDKTANEYRITGGL